MRTSGVSTWHHASGPPAQLQLSQPPPGGSSGGGAAGLPRVSASDSDMTRQQYQYSRRHSVAHSSDMKLSAAPSGPPAQLKLSQPPPGGSNGGGAAGLPRVSASDSDMTRQQYNYSRRHSVPHSSDMKLSAAPISSSAAAVNALHHASGPPAAKVTYRSTPGGIASAPRVILPTATHFSVAWMVWLKMVKWLNAIAFHRKPIKSYGASPAVWDHTMLPATRDR